MNFEFFSMGSRQTRSEIKMLRKKEGKKEGKRSNFPHSRERNGYFHDLIIQKLENFFFISLSFFFFHFIMLHGTRNRRTFSCIDFLK